MSNKHIIEYNGKPAFVIIPYEEYQSLNQLRLNLITDEQIFIQGMENKEEYFPESLVNKIITHPKQIIKFYRKYRNLTQNQLAGKAGVTRQYISSLEKGNRKGTLPTLKKIASVLNIDLEMLNPL